MRPEIEQELKKSRAEGRAEGRVEGRAEGRVEGRAEGRAEEKVILNREWKDKLEKLSRWAQEQDRVNELLVAMGDSEEFEALWQECQQYS